MNASTKEELKALVLSDGLPDILEFLHSVCDEEAERLWQSQQKLVRESNYIYDYESPEYVAASKQRFFWLFLFNHADYTIKGMRDAIRHRGMAEEEIRAERRAEEIRRKEEELNRLKQQPVGGAA